MFGCVKKERVRGIASLPLVGLSGSLAYFTIAEGAEVQREIEQGRTSL